MKAGLVKLYDADLEILNLLSQTNFQVSIMIPNEEIATISASQSNADEWVRKYVLPYYPKTKIRFLLVGNEVLSDNSEKGQNIWLHLVPAMRRIHTSLMAHNIKNIKLRFVLIKFKINWMYIKTNFSKNKLKERLKQLQNYFIVHTAMPSSLN